MLPEGGWGGIERLWSLHSKRNEVGDKALELAGGASYTKFEPILNVNESSSVAGSAILSLSKGDLAPLLEQAARRVATLRVMLLAISRSRTPQVSTNQTSICLTEGVPGIEMRVFLRDKNPDLMDPYLNQGIYRSVPVFAFFDEQMNEVARFIERPPKVTEQIEAKMLAVRRALRAEKALEWRQTVVDEVRGLLKA